jgi:hypothetical protein
MQSKTRQVYVRHGAGRVEPRENITQLNDVLGQNAARIVVSMKTL